MNSLNAFEEKDKLSSELEKLKNDNITKILDFTRKKEEEIKGKV